MSRSRRDTMIRMSPSESARRLAEVARRAGVVPGQVAVGLSRALWEVGPNPVTDFADEIVIEGNPGMTPSDRASWEALGRFREALTTYLVGKEAAFIGGVAVRSYGGRLSPTIDYDLLVSSTTLKEISSFLEREGGVLQGTVESTYTFRIASCELDLDVRVATSPLDQEALKTAKTGTFKDRVLKLVLADFLAAMKVKAFSERMEFESGERDRLDVRGLLRCGATSEPAIRRILAKHRPDLLTVLDLILSSPL